MERNIKHEAADSIDFYMNTIYSVLRSKSETRVSGFEEAHAAMDSTMHHGARSLAPDFNAIIYSVLRMPACLFHVQKIVLGQNKNMFRAQGYADIDDWQPVSAPARRRYCYYDGKDTLALMINSKSDIEDIVPVLTAFQIEWNKIHNLFYQVSPEQILGVIHADDEEKFSKLAEWMMAQKEDVSRIAAVMGDRLGDWLLELKKRPSELRIKLLDSSMIQYSRAARLWAENVIQTCPELRERPVYFVSSNTHSLANLISGYALEKEQELIDFMNEPKNEMLRNEWELINRDVLSASRENLLYYVLKKYQQSERGSYTIREQRECEKNRGIVRIPDNGFYDVEAQVIDLEKINLRKMDPRLRLGDIEKNIDHRALILNIDYPLGMAAYHLLSKLSEELETIRGIYVMGKAASLNGVHGDVIIPSVIHDMHSSNTYLYQNVFSGSDVEPWLKYGSILDGQRAVSVYGTYLQNKEFMDAIYQGGYTDIEMEAGPYLSAVYEMFRPHRHPEDELVDMYSVKIDIGFMHYVSDTPMSKGKNLGAGTLSYFGMDSTYAISIAILRRIFSFGSCRR